MMASGCEGPSGILRLVPDLRWLNDRPTVEPGMSDARRPPRYEDRRSDVSGSRRSSGGRRRRDTRATRTADAVEFTKGIRTLSLARERQVKTIGYTTTRGGRAVLASRYAR